MSEDVPSPGSAGPILLIDDEPFVLQMLSRVFSLNGFKVVTASGGLEGIALARQLRPPIVLTDVTMPKVDGYAVCRYLKSEPSLKDTYVIMLTARARDVDRDRAMAVGADEYITKPVSPRVISAHLREVLERQPAAAG